MQFSIISSPEQPLKAFRDNAGLIVLALQDVIALSVSITTGGKTYVKTFNESEVSGSSITLDISRYVREFTFTDIYVNNLQQKSYPGMVNSYSMTMTATYVNSTQAILSLTGKAIASC